MRIVLAFALLIIAVVVRAETNWSASGSLDVDTLDVEWRDAARDRQIPAGIYYPRNATGACPMIVFSHGLGGTRSNYEYLGRHWASHGFVSVHVQHHGSDDAVWRGSSRPQEAMRNATLDPINARNRPLDVSFALDELTKMNQGGGNLKGKLDMARVGVAGHSFGAWTVLAIAGQGDSRAARRTADQRVKAGIAMSAPVPKDSARRDYEHIRIPILHLTGTADESPIGGTSAKDRRIPFDAITNAPQFLVTLIGGDHMVFSGRKAAGRNASRDAGMRDIICASTTAFWNAFLREDARAKAWLVEGGFEKTLAGKGVFEKKPAPRK
ncbi:MAG TPA: hypothetical protein VK530_12735 [Candidatus Acidoferrum sp.]|nr:hypothetical protein [Candidatus Acidoferrum sp.]